MPRIGFGLNNQQPLSLMRNVVKVAEAEGFETCWVTEGIGAEAPTLIAALAGETSTLKFGTGILPVYNRTPSLLMQLVLSMDQIMEGRFILGLGAGHAPDLLKDHGVTLKRPLRVDPGLREHRQRDPVQQRPPDLRGEGGDGP